MDAVAGVDDDVLAFGDEVFFGLADVGRDDNASFALCVFAVGDETFDFGDDSEFFRFTRFEELCDAGKTADDTARFGVVVWDWRAFGRGRFRRRR